MMTARLPDLAHCFAFAQQTKTDKSLQKEAGWVQLLLMSGKVNNQNTKPKT